LENCFSVHSRNLSQNLKYKFENMEKIEIIHTKYKLYKITAKKIFKC
jgi:hypothetical protein